MLEDQVQLVAKAHNILELNDVGVRVLAQQRNFAQGIAWNACTAILWNLFNGTQAISLSIVRHVYLAIHSRANLLHVGVHPVRRWHLGVLVVFPQLRPHHTTPFAPTKWVARSPSEVTNKNFSCNASREQMKKSRQMPFRGTKASVVIAAPFPVAHAKEPTKRQRPATDASMLALLCSRKLPFFKASTIRCDTSPTVLRPAPFVMSTPPTLSHPKTPCLRQSSPNHSVAADSSCLSFSIPPSPSAPHVTDVVVVPGLSGPVGPVAVRRKQQSVGSVVNVVSK